MVSTGTMLFINKWGFHYFLQLQQKKKQVGWGGQQLLFVSELLVVEFVVIEGWFVNGYRNSLLIVYSGWQVVY